MNRLVVGWILLSFVLVATPVLAQGDGGGAQLPTPKNLQFFEKDITAQQLLTAMTSFNAALGVQCGHCHVVAAPSITDPKNDWASDAKEPKKTARVMLAMVRRTNVSLRSELGRQEDDLTPVQCVMCHRGVAIPKQLSVLLLQTAQKEGIDKATRQYEELRKRYYGAQAYDFTDASLVAAAQQSLTANKPSDALAFIQLNISKFPNSARSYQVQSQVYQRQNQKDAAIASLRKAIELDPMNRGYKTQLEQLQRDGATR